MGRFSKYGLVLSGGGARAAYQAGVLKGIAEIVGVARGEHPFPIITGISAGAINSAFLSAAPSGFSSQADALAKIWNELSPEQVLQTDMGTFSKLSAGWIKDLSFGGMLGKSQSTYLLESSPLRTLLTDKISFDQIHKNIENKTIQGAAVTATSYGTGTSVTFFDSLGIPEWTRSQRIGQNIPINVDHVLASSSIPFVFKPVQIGKNFYGDGGIRANAPISPAIHLGADKILAIGVRYCRSGSEVLELNNQVSMDTIVLSDIAGVMFNSVFLDAIEFDHERLQRINQTVKIIHENHNLKESTSLKIIPSLLIQPSIDLGTLAADQFERFPRMLKYLLRGIGTSKERGADLLSYIAFDSAYTKKLVDIGFKDAMDRRSEIEAFFEMDKTNYGK